MIKEVKNTVPRRDISNVSIAINISYDLNGEEIIGTLYGKELRKTNQQRLRIEKVIKRKEINYMSNGKDMITHLIAGLIKKTLSNETPLYKNESMLF